MDKLSDQQLFSLIAAGDQSAYTVIYEKYTGQLYSYILKLLKSELWAEEVVHDIFMNLWISRAELHDVANPTAFLYRMAANRTIDWIRRHELELKVMHYTRLRSSGITNTTEELVDFRAGETLVREAIDALATQRKLIYRLKHEEGLSYDEIAARLAISRHTVRNQLAKSLEHIRAYVESRGGLSLAAISLIPGLLKTFFER